MLVAGRLGCLKLKCGPCKKRTMKIFNLLKTAGKYFGTWLGVSSLMSATVFTVDNVELPTAQVPPRVLFRSMYMILAI